MKPFPAINKKHRLFSILRVVAKDDRIEKNTTVNVTRVNDRVILKTGT